MTTLDALIGALLVKPALVIGATAVVAASLRRHTAAARHAVWAGAIVATLALPLMGRALPSLRVTPLVAAIEGLLPASTRPAGATSHSAGAGPSNAVDVGPLERLSGALRRSRAGTADPVPAAIMACWMVGVVLLGGRRVIAEMRMRRIVRRARPVEDTHVAELFSDLVRSSGARRTVQLRMSDEIPSPAVAGRFRPVVLLPTIAGSWTRPDLTATLVHELGHVARRDALFAVLADLALIFYWCNPIVRLAVRRVRAESENACDDRVLHGGAEPERYAHLLLAVARATQVDGGLPSASTAMARPRELESRLLAVLDPRVPRHPLPRWVPAALGGLGVLVALPTAALSLRAAPLTTVQVTAPEPDRLGDSLSGPMSERLPLAPGGHRVSPAATGALSGPDSLLVRRLVAALEHVPRHDGDLIRDRAAWALSQVRDAGLVQPLLDALDAGDWRVQSYAAWALATARDPRATDRLVPLLGHPVWRLRAMAAYALRESQDPRAEDAMSAALTDPAWQVRLEAVEYFAALNDRDRSARLRPQLVDRHVAVRVAAERALTR